MISLDFGTFFFKIEALIGLRNEVDQFGQPHFFFHSVIFFRRLGKVTFTHNTPYTTQQSS